MKIVKGSYGAYCIVLASGRSLFPRTIVHEIKKRNLQRQAPEENVGSVWRSTDGRRNILLDL